MKAYRVYLTLNLVTSVAFWLAFAVNSIYYVTVARLDPLQLVLVGTTLEAAVFLFEIPTGVVADVYSRRLSIIIGIFMIGAGFLLEGSLPVFGAILLSQVLWGIGYTFTSGATQAWITDEVGGEEAAAPIFLRGAQFDQLGSLAGILLSTILAAVTRINLPILACGAIFIGLGFFLILVMPETGFHPTPRSERTTWNSMLHVMRSGLGTVRHHPTLSSILVAGFFFGLYSEGLDRLWTVHLLQRFTFPLFPTVVWIGGIELVSLLLAMLATELVKRKLNLKRWRSLVGTLLALSTIIFICLLGFSQAWSLALAIGFYWVLTALRHVISPLYTATVNQGLSSEVRATVISVSSQVDAIGQIGGGPLVGLIARQASIPVGLLGSALLLTPALGILGRIFNKRVETIEAD